MGFSFIFKADVIYTAIITMGLGAITIMVSRRDLIKESVVGGLLFFLIYFVFFFILNVLIFPGWIEEVWNFENLLGITILTIPVEELLFALTFGALWGPLYEDLKNYVIK